MNTEIATKSKDTDTGVIPREWSVLNVGKIGRVVTGKTPPTNNPEYYGDDYPFVKIPDMTDSVYVNKTNTRISQKGADYLGKAKIPKNSIMVSCIATIGNVGITSEDSFTNQQINSLIPNKDVADFKYLYYFFKLNKELLESLGGGGSVYTNISKSKFESMPVVLPGIREQKNISEILSSLDDKIELNRKINNNLEKIASLLFKQWFIDFDFPNQNGKPYKSSGGKMIGSEIGKIPEIFETKRAISLLAFIKGIEPGSKNYYNEFDDDEVYFYRVADMFNGVKPNIFIKKIDSKNIFCNYDDVLISTDGTVGRVVVGIKGSYSGGIRKVISLDESTTNEFIYFWLKSQYVQNIFEEYAANATTIAHASGALEDLIIPYNAKIFKDFGNTIEPTFKLIKKNLKQNNDLSDLRDSLLPRLMNGKIRVKI
jgi:type I restriction enzyme S subunit